MSAFIKNFNHPCQGLPGIIQGAATSATTGHSTYLHSGIKPGWPYDHSSEDTFELPPPNPTMFPNFTVTRGPAELPEYKAEFGTDGSARVYLYSPRKLVGSFDTFADARLTAEALNNLMGY